jgi:hypothetical protein
VITDQPVDLVDLQLQMYQKKKEEKKSNVTMFFTCRIATAGETLQRRVLLRVLPRCFHHCCALALVE